ncbi:hypothetical protein XA1311A_23790 [Xanthomonas arboricola]|nr:hypothetical protein XA1311A_23790 [Xanthomonas arboricola]CAE6780130.1 hypothetical protein XA1311A_23790 [Xanthomonas arboricola]
MSTAGLNGQVGARLSATGLPGTPRRALVRSYGWLRRSRLPFAVVVDRFCRSAPERDGVTGNATSRPGALLRVFAVIAVAICGGG